MRILVTGSRDWTDEDRVRSVLFYFARGIREVTLVSGACPPRWIVGKDGKPRYVKGADRIAEEVAASYDWAVELHPADWDGYGKRAGFIRNEEMVSLGAHICCAFIRNNSNGASMTAKLAEKAGIRVHTEREDD